MAPSLPTNPDLARLRRDARRLQRAVRARDPDALRLVAARHPDGLPADPADFRLAGAQLVVARAHGFASWTRLRGYLADAAPLAWRPSAAVGEDPADAFCALACLTYSEDHPDRWARAAALLEQHPDLPGQSVWAAAAAGEPGATARHLERDPSAAGAAGGPRGWAPLLYLAYARVPQSDAVGTARLLLDAGADPDAGFLWGGLTPPFTVLTGVFGEGEGGPGPQPRHPQWRPLAELVLAAGAEPNDGQTLYNRMFGVDDSHLELLFAHGLGRGDGGVWRQRLGAGLEPVPAMMRTQVRWALDHGYTARVALLAAHGFGTGPQPERPPSVHRAATADAVAAAVAAGADVDELRDGRTALHEAAFLGDVALIRALLAAGADPDLRDPEHHATPLGWAEWACQPEAIAVLRAVTAPA